MSKQYATNKQIEELEQRLTNKIAMLQADLKNYKQEMGQLRSENRELREENQALKREIESNKESINAAEVKADDLENRQRRNNLVFHGIGGDEIRETWEHVEEKVKEFVQRDLLVGAVRGKNRGLGEQLDKSMKLFPVDLWVIYLSSGGGPKKSTV